MANYQQYLLGLFIALLQLSFGRAQHLPVFEQVMQNVRVVQWSDLQSSTSLDFSKSDIRNVHQLDEQVGKLSNSMLQTGSWQDVDYKATMQTAWLPSQHLVRLHQMALGYTLRASNHYGDSKLFSQIQNGLYYWWHADPRSTNWWYQQIFCPKQVGEMLILLRSGKQHLDKNLEDSLIARMMKIGGMPDGPYSTGGSNRINIAAHWIYRGCLTADISVLEEGIRNALLPVRFCIPAGGLQYDYSYQEHGAQLYIGNYGYAFVDNVSNIALYLRNTVYALSKEQLQIFSAFVRKTYIPSVRGQYYSFSIPGRQLANKDNLNRSKSANILEKMLRIDTAYAAYYKGAIQRWVGMQPASYKVVPVHRQYYISDYTTHIRPAYTFDVRYVSNRTVRTENINNEDKKGFFLSDGATNMTIDGGEYDNIAAVWDWCRIPGVTAPHIDLLPDMKIDVGGDVGMGSFSGGVSDGMYGASCYSMDYSRFATKAQKSWFFFDNEIVCLGAGISSSYEAPVATTVNQCLSKGTVYIGQRSKVSTTKHLFGEQRFEGNLDWVVHNSFGYCFPSKENVVVRNAVQIGNWYSIAVSQEDKLVQDSVFSLWIEHGKNPSEQTYSYIIVPNIKNANQMQQYVGRHTVSIIANTTSLQAVKNKQLQMVQAIVYKGGQRLQLDKDYILEVGQPCALILHKNKEGWRCTIADPGQHLEKLSLEVVNQHNGKRKSNLILLPVGVRKGDSVNYQLILGD